VPLYKNPLFQQPDLWLKKRCVWLCPHYGKDIDYTKVSCPVCEQVCSDTVWLPHRLLLAEPEDVRKAADAIKKVCENADELK